MKRTLVALERKMMAQLNAGAMKAALVEGASFFSTNSVEEGYAVKTLLKLIPPKNHVVTSQQIFRHPLCGIEEYCRTNCTVQQIQNVFRRPFCEAKNFDRDRDCSVSQEPFASITVIGVTADTITVILDDVYKRVLRLEEQDFGYADGPSYFVKDGESDYGSIGFSNFHPELVDPWWMWTINDPDMSEEMAKAEAKKEKLRTAVNMIKEIVASAVYSHWGYKPEYMRRIRFSGVKVSDVWNAFCTKEA